MDTNSPVPQQPAPADHGWGVSAWIGAVIVVVLIAAGAYFLVQGGFFSHTPAPLEPGQTGQDQTAQPQQGSDSIDSLEGDLNASGSVDNSQDLDSLQQSL